MKGYKLGKPLENKMNLADMSEWMTRWHPFDMSLFELVLNQILNLWDLEFPCLAQM